MNKILEIRIRPLFKILNNIIEIQKHHKVSLYGKHTKFNLQLILGQNY